MSEKIKPPQEFITTNICNSLKYRLQQKYLKKTGDENGSSRRVFKIYDSVAHFNDFQKFKSQSKNKLNSDDTCTKALTQQGTSLQSGISQPQSASCQNHNKYALKKRERRKNAKKRRKNRLNEIKFNNVATAPSKSNLAEPDSTGNTTLSLFQNQNICRSQASPTFAMPFSISSSAESSSTDKSIDSRKKPEKINFNDFQCEENDDVIEKDNPDQIMAEDDGSQQVNHSNPENFSSKPTALTSGGSLNDLSSVEIVDIVSSDSEDENMQLGSPVPNSEVWFSAEENSQASPKTSQDSSSSTLISPSETEIFDDIVNPQNIFDEDIKVAIRKFAKDMSNKFSLSEVECLSTLKRNNFSIIFALQELKYKSKFENVKNTAEKE